MRWVTFYHDVMHGKVVVDYKEHKDKAAATKYFQQNYAKYFQLAQKIKCELPMCYGFAFRAYYGCSIRTFKSKWGEYEIIEE
ncbi:MAG: hypothetical protein J6N51_10610 [Selenomonas sp.]|nr:hypothetical protein [Selenomonas sp.]